MSDALKYDFEGQQAIAGFCEVLPDESILFAATLQDKASRTKQITYHYENNAWFEMTGRQIQQLALAEQDTTRILAAEQTLTELIWEHSDETTDGDEPIAWLFDSQEIDWHSEKFKHFKWIELAGIANSIILASKQRFQLNGATRTLRGWRFGDKLITAGRRTWVEDIGPARVRLSIFVDNALAIEKTFEFTRDELRPIRVPINRRGIAIQVRLEGLGALILRGLRLEVSV